MTQREFWAAIEARTSKEVADFGFADVCEDNLPGCEYYWNEEGVDCIECADLDAAAAAAKHAYEAWKEGE